MGVQRFLKREIAFSRKGFAFGSGSIDGRARSPTLSARAAAPEWIAYAGLQIAFAYFMCLLQGFGPGTDFDTIRDRIVGILLGIGVMILIFCFIWPERPDDRLRRVPAGS